MFHIIYSCIFHLCFLLLHFPLLHFLPLQFCSYRIFHSRIFSPPYTNYIYLLTYTGRVSEPQRACWISPLSFEGSFTPNAVSCGALQSRNATHRIRCERSLSAKACGVRGFGGWVYGGLNFYPVIKYRDPSLAGRGCQLNCVRLVVH